MTGDGIGDSRRVIGEQICALTQLVRGWGCLKNCDLQGLVWEWEWWNIRYWKLFCTWKVARYFYLILTDRRLLKNSKTHILYQSCSRFQNLGRLKINLVLNFHSVNKAAALPVSNKICKIYFLFWKVLV